MDSKPYAGTQPKAIVEVADSCDCCTSHAQSRSQIPIYSPGCCQNEERNQRRNYDGYASPSRGWVSVGASLVWNIEQFVS
jgi:hypothetical protein